MKKKQEQIQVKLSAIFQQKVVDTSQAFGSFYEANGQKYCAISALSKFFGYDIAAALSRKMRNEKNTDPAELIPYAILEMIESFAVYGNPEDGLRCFCSRPDYYYYGLISLLIHLNDYHKMSFTEIGNWLESKGI